MIGGTGAEVDTETGHVRVIRLVNVPDAGTPINPSFSVAPAVANAIADAAGVRLMQLPLTPEAVLRALRARDNRPLE